jgi:hypothetical protein
MKAWHFVGKTLRDGSSIPVDGVPLVYHGELKLCHSGLHASIDPFDALQYAPGNTLCLVDCTGNILHGGDKFVCSERTIIARMEATELLYYFARMQALSIIHLYPMRKTGEDDVILDYLMTGDETQQTAAENAAWTAAEATRDADWNVAIRAATWTTAFYAARAAARAATWTAGDDFNNLVRECFKDYL